MRERLMLSFPVGSWNFCLTCDFNCLCDQSSVGKGIVNKALCANPSFDIYFGIDGWMLSMLTSGMNPVTCVLDCICQVALMGLLRFISLFYLMNFSQITQSCYDTKKVQKDSCKID